MFLRKDGASSGTISWKFHLESEDNVIESIDVKFLSKTFETGKISAKLLMDDFSIAVPTGEFVNNGVYYSTRI